MNDPFEEARREGPVLPCEFAGETVPMILRHADVRAAAKDWMTLSSDAPFRVPIPSEEDVRTVRQLPIETDPPQHTAYRRIVEPFFKRAKDPNMVAKVEALTTKLLRNATNRDKIEIVREFALPLQSHALTYLLNVDESEAETWIDWGIHVFRDGGDGSKRGAALDNYLNEQLDKAERSSGDDFFSALTGAEYEGRPLTRAEMLGFANLTFAGGRDTIIHTVSSVFHYCAEHPEALDFMRKDPRHIVSASEEFFRVISPLTHIGRVCKHASDVHGFQVKPEGRVSLCWVSANHDAKAFDAPQETRLDRKPNPHMAFGAGAHICLGAPHARLLLRTLLQQLCENVSSIEIFEATPRVEKEACYERTAGFDALTVKVSS